MNTYIKKIFIYLNVFFLGVFKKNTNLYKKLYFDQYRDQLSIEKNSSCFYNYLKQRTLFLHLFLFFCKEKNVISSFNIPMMKNDDFL